MLPLIIHPIHFHPYTSSNMVSNDFFNKNVEHLASYHHMYIEKRSDFNGDN